jgi:hypothetical protein
VGRDDDIEAIVDHGRRTRKRTPRWLWTAALIVGAICVTGFTIMMLGSREPPSSPVEQRPQVGSGLGFGLVIGVGAGVVIGFSIGRQRRSHSSRKNP